MNKIKMSNYYLMHHGVKGMRWGIRKQSSSSGSGHQSVGTPTASKSNKEKVKKAAKIGAAVAVTALAAYGGYKVYKLHGEATTSLGKKYYKEATKKHSLAFAQLNKASDWANESDRYKIRAGESKNSAERKIFLDASKNVYKLATEKRSEADKTFEDAYRLRDIAKNQNFSKKEIVKEMGDIAKKRFRR